MATIIEIDDVTKSEIKYIQKKIHNADGSRAPP